MPPENGAVATRRFTVLYLDKRPFRG